MGLFPSINGITRKYILVSFMVDTKPIDTKPIDTKPIDTKLYHFISSCINQGRWYVPTITIS